MKPGPSGDRRWRLKAPSLILAGLLVAAGTTLVTAWGVQRARVSRAALEAAQKVDRLLDEPVPTPPPEDTPPPVSTPTVLPTTTAPPLPTATPVPVTGGAMGRLEIPRLHLTVPVLEGVGNAELDAGAGHFPETAALGDHGNCALAAHRDTHFRKLAQIETGDRVVVQVPGRSLRYHVVSTEVVDPGAVGVLDETADDRLTLVTCYPFSWIGPAPRRFVVVAERDDAGGDMTTAAEADMMEPDHDHERSRAPSQADQTAAEPATGE